MPYPLLGIAPPPPPPWGGSLFLFGCCMPLVCSQLDSKWNAKYTEDEKKWEQKYLHDWELWSVRLAEVQRQLNYQQECLVQSNEENRYGTCRPDVSGYHWEGMRM